jgi:hypothetical protein
MLHGPVNVKSHKCNWMYVVLINIIWHYLMCFCRETDSVQRQWSETLFRIWEDVKNHRRYGVINVSEREISVTGTDTYKARVVREDVSYCIVTISYCQYHLLSATLSYYQLLSGTALSYFMLLSGTIIYWQLLWDTVNQCVLMSA